MIFKGLNKRIAVIALVLVVALLSQFFVDVTVSDAQPVVRIAMAQSASVEDADYVCDGEDDDIQWQLAVNAVSGGGKVEDLCGCTYNFGNEVTIPSSDITIRGIGGQTYFTRDASSDIFNAASYSRCLFQDFRTDGGGITHDTNNDSYIQNVWIGSTYYFEGPEGGAGGNVTQEDVEDWSGAMWTSNTETRATVSYQDADGTLDIVVDDMNDDVPESGDFGAAGDLDADGTITDGVIDEADFDCDNAPIDEYVLTFEASTGNVEWEADQTGAGGGCPDVYSTVSADAGSASSASGCSDTLNVEGGTHIDTSSDGAGNITVNLSDGDHGDLTYTAGTATLDNDVVAPAEMADADHGDATWTSGVMDIDANTIGTSEITNDSIDEIDLHVDNAPTDEWFLSFEGDTGNLAWQQQAGDDMGSVDTEAELEAVLSDTSDVFTDNDGALDDDDVSAADVGLASANLDDTDASVEWEDASDLDAAGDVADDSHNHTTTTVSGLDISADTNLTAGDHITLIDDDLDVDDDFLLNTGDAGTGDYNFTGAVFLGGTPWVFEGATANEFETSIVVTDPTADRTITLPDATGEVSLLGQGIDISDETNLTAGDYLTLTDDDIDHDAVLRNMPQMFACSTSGNTSTAIGDCEQIDFNGMELHVREITAGNSTAMFHIRTPDDFGFGGNTTLTVSYGIRVTDGSSGSALVMRTKVGTSTSDVQSASWNNSANLAWVQVDEIHWTSALVIDESLPSGEQDIYILCDYLSEDWDSTAFYWDKFQVKAWGA